MEVIKVSARSRSTAVAGAIAGVIRDEGYAEVQAIGASAVNQAVKAVAIARGYLQEDGIAIVSIPVFVEVDIQGLERTAVKIVVWSVDHSVLPGQLLALFEAEEAAQGEAEAQDEGAPTAGD
ncbi:MAG TPA: stage V sporulation protein S [Anaerolineae bacterium]|nr:stage V sporulation protein S [Anaerolineae bacterium]